MNDTIARPPARPAPTTARCPAGPALQLGVQARPASARLVDGCADASVCAAVPVGAWVEGIAVETPAPPTRRRSPRAASPWWRSPSFVRSFAMCILCSPPSCGRTLALELGCDDLLAWPPLVWPPSPPPPCLLVASDSTTAAASRLAARCSDRCRVEHLAHQLSLSSARRRLPLLTAVVVTLTLRASGGPGMRSATAVVSIIAVPACARRRRRRAIRASSARCAMRTRPGRGVLVAGRADCGDRQLATHVLTQHRTRPSRRRPWRWRVRCAPTHPYQIRRQPTANPKHDAGVSGAVVHQTHTQTRRRQTADLQSGTWPPILELLPKPRADGVVGALHLDWTLLRVVRRQGHSTSTRRRLPAPRRRRRRKACVVTATVASPHQRPASCWRPPPSHTPEAPHERGRRAPLSRSFSTFSPSSIPSPRDAANFANVA